MFTDLNSLFESEIEWMMLDIALIIFEIFSVFDSFKFNAIGSCISIQLTTKWLFMWWDEYCSHVCSSYAFRYTCCTLIKMQKIFIFIFHMKHSKYWNKNDKNQTMLTIMFILNAMKVSQINRISKWWKYGSFASNDFLNFGRAFEIFTFLRLSREFKWNTTSRHCHWTVHKESVPEIIRDLMIPGVHHLCGYV